MNASEVNAIYEYLHDNYTYHCDGYFINKKTNVKIEGGIVRNCKKFLTYICVRLINKTYRLQYSHTIYLYHHRVKPKYIEFIDGNEVNLRLDNLRISSMSRRNLRNRIEIKNINSWPGVIKNKDKFYGRIMVNGKFKWLKARKCPFAAYIDYLKAKQEYMK